MHKHVIHLVLCNIHVFGRHSEVRAAGFNVVFAAQRRCNPRSHEKDEVHLLWLVSEVKKTFVTTARRFNCRWVLTKPMCGNYFFRVDRHLEHCRCLLNVNCALNAVEFTSPWRKRLGVSVYTYGRLYAYKRMSFHGKYEFLRQNGEKIKK
jgi:hypothetical protein